MLRPPSGSPALLLFPTELERRRFRDLGGLPPGHALEALAGFGPVAAAARTSQLLGRLRPRRVLLAGIAGTFDEERFPLGAALAFGSVALDGLGVGEGEELLTPSALGFAQWPGEAGGAPRVEERLALELPAGCADPLLLTACAASGSPREAERRRARFPQAAAEDMEGFGVALACALHGVPLTILRGISNRVGERDAERWRIPAALGALRRLLLELLDQPGPRAAREEEAE